MTLSFDQIHSNLCIALALLNSKDHRNFIVVIILIINTYLMNC